MPCPDSLRGLHLDGRAAARAAIAEAHAAGGRVAAFFSESILSCGGQVRQPWIRYCDVVTRCTSSMRSAPPPGRLLMMVHMVSCAVAGSQVVLPNGYLQDVYAEMRAEGAVCVADEVRVSGAAVQSEQTLALAVALAHRFNARRHGQELCCTRRLRQTVVHVASIRWFPCYHCHRCSAALGASAATSGASRRRAWCPTW